jgi:PAS domain S-box-containing protein
MIRKRGAPVPSMAALSRPGVARYLLALALAASLPFLALTAYLAIHVVTTSREHATEDLHRSAEVTINSLERVLTRLNVLLKGLSERELTRALDPARCDPALLAVMRLNNDYTNVFTVDRAGRRMCSAIKAPAATADHVDPTLYLEAAAARGAMVVSGPTLDEITSTWTAYAAMPLMEAGATKGAIVVGIDLKVLAQVLDPRTLPTAGVVSIVDARGKVVTRRPDTHYWIGRDASASEPHNLARGSSRAVYRAAGLDGVDRFWTFRPVPFTDWRLFTGVHAEFVLQGPRGLALAILTASLLITLGGLYLSMRIARRIAAPIRAIAAAAPTLGAEGAAPLPASGPAEVVTLANQLNRMHEERLAVDRRLHEERARLEGLVSSAMDAVVTVDSSHRVVLFNAAAERMFGIDAAEAMGEHVGRFIPERFRARHDAHMAKFAEARVTSRQMGAMGIVRARRENGEEFPIEAAISQVTVGTERYLTAIVRDISARVKSEIEMRELAANLEQRVVERTAELEAANAELQAFDYSISHDLRAPLGRIHGYADALLEDHGPSLPPPARGFLERIVAIARETEQMVTDMLALSTVSRREIVREEVDLGAMAASIVEGLRRAAPAREVEVVLQPGLVARADPGLARVLLDNLVGNAWKYCARRPGARIELGLEDTPRGRFFFVRDNGAGFDPANAAMLFQPFRRLHTAAEFEGTGIGLATARRIVRRHGGDIWAESTPGEGATFYFTLEPW